MKRGDIPMLRLHFEMKIKYTYKNNASILYLLPWKWQIF